MSNDSQPDAGANQSQNIVSDYYEGYTDTQKELLAIQIRKTRNILFTLAIIIFASDLIGLLAANAVIFETLLIIAVIPLLLVGLAFLALKEPLLAIIIAALLIVSIWIYNIVMTGGVAAITGWLIKALIVYFIIAGFQNALEAMRIRKELKN
jgi:hypothetical protein